MPSHPFGRMPYSMCPICGSTMHLRVGDPEAWYAERYPDVPVGATVPGPCFFCFAEIVVGTQVVTRRLVGDNVTVEPGQRGEVTAIHVNREYGNLYAVTLAPSGKTLLFPRAAIRKLRDGER